MTSLKLGCVRTYTDFVQLGCVRTYGLRVWHNNYGILASNVNPVMAPHSYCWRQPASMHSKHMYIMCTFVYIIIAIAASVEIIMCVLFNYNTSANHERL